MILLIYLKINVVLFMQRQYSAFKKYAIKQSKATLITCCCVSFIDLLLSCTLHIKIFLSILL